MLALFSLFIIEMVIILMNLIIGLAISNIQEMRQNADALRLAKEVLLQCYLETLLQVIINIFLHISQSINFCLGSPCIQA